MISHFSLPACGVFIHFANWIAFSHHINMPCMYKQAHLSYEVHKWCRDIRVLHSSQKRLPVYGWKDCEPTITLHVLFWEFGTIMKFHTLQPWLFLHACSSQNFVTIIVDSSGSFVILYGSRRVLSLSNVCRVYQSGALWYVGQRNMQAMSYAEYLSLLLCGTLPLFYVGWNCHQWIILDQLHYRKDKHDTLDLVCTTTTVMSLYILQRCEAKFCHCLQYSHPITITPRP